MNIATLLLMAVPAYILAKCKMLKREAAVNTLSALLLYVCTPAIMISSFLKVEYQPQIAKNLVALLLFTMIFIGGLSFVGKLIFRGERDESKRGIYAFATAFGNVGYLCVPFLQILLPNEPLVILYASCCVVGFNLVGWTIGYYHITNERRYISLKKIVLNPAFLTFVVVLPLFLLNVNTVKISEMEPFVGIADRFAGAVGVLSMSILGIKFADLKRSDFADAKMILSCAIKLLVSPALAFGCLALMSIFMDTSAIRLNIIALAAMPVANNSMMFAALAGKDTTLAAKLVLISTLLSILTIPLALTLFV